MTADDHPIIPIDPDLAPTDPAEPSVSHHRTRARLTRSRAQPAVLAAIGLGGAVGASARFAVAERIPTQVGHFPWATFWTNVSGSFLLGFLLVVLLERFPTTRLVRPFLTTGILGAFTTMSTLQVETALLLKEGHLATAAICVSASLVAGLGLAYIGIVAGRLTPRRTDRGRS